MSCGIPSHFSEGHQLNLSLKMDLHIITTTNVIVSMHGQARASHAAKAGKHTHICVRLLFLWQESFNYDSRIPCLGVRT